ncbi:MAG: DUF3822 family protein [Flavobacteriales bacterium]|nr:DUF3822 family protein [Flavobacteriales bacterium]
MNEKDELHFGENPDPLDIQKVYVEENGGFLFAAISSSLEQGAIVYLAKIKLNQPLRQSLLNELQQTICSKWSSRDNVPLSYCANGQNTLIPKEFYEKKLESKYLRLNHFDYDVKKHHNNRDYISWLNTQNIYFQSLAEVDDFRGQFPKTKFTHRSSLFIRALQLIKEVDGTTILMECTMDQMMMGIINSKGQLKFFNTFKIAGSNDILYFALGTLKNELGEQYKNVTIKIMGSHPNLSEITAALGEYVYIETVPTPEHYLNLNSDNPPSEFTSLILHSVCA